MLFAVQSLSKSNIARGSGLKFVVLLYPILILLMGGSLLATDKSVGPKPGGRLYLAGNLLFVAASCQGLQILEISDPRRPIWVGAWQHPDAWCVTAVQVAGGYAFAVSSFAGVNIIDVRSPKTPRTIGKFNTGGAANAIHVIDHHAFVVNQDRGLRVVDVGNPSAPKTVATDDEFRWGEAIQVNGHVAYVAAGPYGLKIFDISNRAMLRPVGNYVQDKWSCDALRVVDDHVFIGSGWHQFNVVDVSRSTSPAMLATMSLGGAVRGLDIDGQHAYVPQFISHSGLEIFDISKPRTPRSVSKFPTAQWIWDVRVGNGFAYLIDRNDNLMVLDITNPEKPVETGRFDASGFASRWIALKPDKLNVLPPSVTEDNSTTASGRTAPPVLAYPTRRDSGAFSFTLVATPGQSYAIQASTDLQTWQPISTNTLSETGSEIITDLDAATFEQRYYRAVRQ